jgi:tetratricopeptide (TPR) repeat protein
VLLSPRSPGLLLELARAQRDAGDRRAALASLNEALSAADSPDEEFEVRRALSEHFQSLGRLREARAQADTAYRVSTEFQHEIQQDITRLEMLDLVALTDGPAPALAEASDIQGRLPRPFAGLAAYGPFRVYRALRDPGGLENATMAFREGVARTPFAGSFEDEIAEAEGYVYLWRGECAAAVERLTEATELVPGSLDARLALARARLCSGDLSGASSELESAARLSPADPTLQVLRAEVSLAGGDTVSARRDLDAALDAWAGADPGFGPREEALRLRSAL